MADISKTRARFPLAWKLSLAISGVLVFSLGAIILAVWLVFRADAAKSAAADNDSINIRTAAAAKTMLEKIRSETILLFLDTLSGEGELGDYYFTRNPSIAAVVSLDPEGGVKTMINGDFVRASEISGALITEYLNIKGNLLLNTQSETLLVNASPDFNGLPMLAARFPYTAGNSVSLEPSVAIVLFSSSELADYFSYGASQSLLIADSGEVLIQSGDSLPEDPAAPSVMRSFYESGGDHLITNVKGELFASVRSVDFGAALLTFIPGSVIFEGINATTRRNLFLALAVWFVSLLFIGLFSSRLTRRLGMLREAAEAIEDGMYKEPIVRKSRDEAGYLAERMNNMRTALLNFERFTNKQTARLTRKGILKPGGTDKNAVFLFCDIRSFTSLSETMAPEALVSLLNEYMETMVACIMVNGGVVDKFIGDAILAHWGAMPDASDSAPEASPRAERSGSPEHSAPLGNFPSRETVEHIRAAFRTALLMRAALASFNKNHDEKKRPLIQNGIGISGGKVAAGLIGTEERLVYSVIGDAVNTAEKAESCNKYYGTEILISSETLKAAGTDFITERLPAFTSASEKLVTLVNVRGEDETKRVMAGLEQIPAIDMDIARRVVGAEGPKTTRELRALLGIPQPDLSRIRIHEREKKFKVQKS